MTRTSQIAHQIGKQTIRIKSADPDQVAQMQPRIARLNSTSLHALIEKVFCEFAPEDRLIAIENISLDLGQIPIDSLEYALESRLRAALKEKLANLIPVVRPMPIRPPSNPGHSDWTSQSIVQLLTASPASPTAKPPLSGKLFGLLQKAFQYDPEETGKLLRQTAKRPGAVTQLTRLLQPFQLESLVRALDPWNATTLILLAGTVTESYDASPLDKKPLGGFDKPVWNLILNYLLSEPGTEFNRRQYVTSLLEKIAADTGLLLSDVIDIVAAGLELLDRRRRVRTSLASVLRKVMIPQGESKSGDAEKPSVPSPARSNTSSAEFGPLSPRSLHKALRDAGHTLGHDLTKRLEHHLRHDRAGHPADRAEIGREFSSRQLQRLARYLLQDSIGPNASLIIQLLPAAMLEAMLSALGQSEQAGLLKVALMTAYSGSESAGARLASAETPEMPADGTPDTRAQFAPSPNLQRKGAQEKDLSVLLDYVRTGRLSIADRQRLRISSAIALNRTIRETAARHRKHFAAAVRIAAQSPRTTKAWASDLEPETLGLLADCAIPGRGRRFLAGARALDRIARRARISSDRIARLSADFWQFQFAHLEDLRGTNATETFMISAFLESLTSPNRAKAEEHQRRILAALEDVNAPRQMREKANPERPDQNLYRLVDALERSGSGALKALEALDPKARQALLGKALTSHARSRRAIEKLSDRQFRGLLALSLGTSARQLSAVSRTLLEAVHMLGTVASVARQTLVLRIFLLEFCEDEAGNKLDLPRLLNAFSQTVLPQLLLPGGPLRKSRSNSWHARLNTRWLTNVRILARGKREVLLERSAAQAMSRKLSQRRLAIHKATAHQNSMRGFTPVGKELASMTLQPDPARSAGPSASDEQAVRNIRYSLATHGSEFNVTNAGLALAAPLLPHLFTQCDLLDEESSRPRAWRDRTAYARAVYLTQYLVIGSNIVRREDLALNKIICGGDPGDTLQKEFEPNDQERLLCEQLLQAMLANWPPLSTGTTAEGLREGFLQRNGQLTRTDAGWSLTVERKTLDVLLNQVGWGFRTILLPWQTQPLQVTW